MNYMWNSLRKLIEKNSNSSDQLEIIMLRNKIQPRECEDLIGFTKWLMKGAASHVAGREGLLGAEQDERFL